MKIEIFRQLYASVIVSLPILHFSWICGGSNTDLLRNEFRNSGSPSLLVSFLSVGGIIGSVSQFWLFERIGRKNSIILLTIPSTVACWILILANNTDCLHFAWLIIGLAAGTASVSIPIFITEISSNNIRGILNTLFPLAYFSGHAIGMLVAHLVRDYREQVTYSFLIPTIFAVGFCFLPESPVYLRQIERIKEAEDSLQFYQGSKSLPEAEKFIVQSVTAQFSTCRKDFFGTPIARKILLISAFMIAIPNICGPIVLLNYTAEFSTHSKLLSPVEPTLLVAVIPLGATLITIFLIDLVGRKLLLVGSLIGTAVGFFFIFVHQLLIDRFPHTEWIQFSVLLLTILMACIGILPVSHVYKMDILPPKIRNMAVSVLHLFYWILSACTMKAYPYLILHIHAYFIALAGVCVLCALFVLIYVPETKGKSNRNIERLQES